MKHLLDASQRPCVWPDQETLKENTAPAIPFALRNVSGMRYSAPMESTHVDARMMTYAFQERRTNTETYALLCAHQNVQILNFSAQEQFKVTDAEDNLFALSTSWTSMELCALKFAPNLALIEN